MYPNGGGPYRIVSSLTSNLPGQIYICFNSANDCKFFVLGFPPLTEFDKDFWHTICTNYYGFDGIYNQL